MMTLSSMRRVDFVIQCSLYDIVALYNVYTACYR